ncbi:MAG: NUDIX domain-containing protein [Acidobacteria bacterium]|nr:NUDIX domain-containing protein [Acidobacteriota bacterium]
MTADALILTGMGAQMQILVIERAREPYAGQLALPGGFVDPNEHPLAASIRECLEETGLVLDARTAVPLSLRSRAGRDPRGWTLSQPYLFYLDQPLPPKAGDDARRAEWVPLAEIQRFAFDHGAIVCEGLSKFWGFMPGHEPRLSEIQAFGQPSPTLQSPIFFGGTFNPWHAGHEACIQAWPDPELILVPDQNPNKPLTDLECAFAAYRHFQKIIAQRGCVYPGFLGRETPNPTAHWLPYVLSPSRRFLLGADSFVQLSQWFEADSWVDDIAEWGVVPRNVSSSELEAACQWLRLHAPNAQLRLFDHHAFEHLSSTALRQRHEPA